MIRHVFIFLALIASAVTAHADTFLFNFSGYTENYLGIVQSDTFSFVVDTSTLTNGTVTSFNDPKYWELSYVIPTATVNGYSATNLYLGERDIVTSDSEYFYDTLSVSGDADVNKWFSYFYTSYTYSTFLTGGLNEPVIQTGSFALRGENYVYSSPAVGTLVITDLTPPASPVPEPATFFLFATGLIGVTRVVRKSLSIGA